MALWLVLILSIVTVNSRACDLLTFITNSDLADQTTTTHLIKELTQDTRAECATTCVRREGCVSIFYDQETKLCRLHSDDIATSDAGLSPSAGFIYFEMFCPGLDPSPPVSKGRTQLYIQDCQAKVKVVCDDPLFMFTGNNGAFCFDVVQWSSRGRCEQFHWFNMTTPFRIRYFDYAVLPGFKLIFDGKALPTGFNVIIRDNSGGIPLNVLLGDDGKITRMVRFGGSWQTPFAVNYSDAVYPPGDSFKMVLEFSEADIMGTITGNSVFKFSSAVPGPYEDIVQFDIMNAVEVHEVLLEIPLP